MDDNQACENTDREIWRGPDEGCGDYYADSLHITKEGALGINCAGSVYVKPIREWHGLAGGPIRAPIDKGNAMSVKELKLDGGLNDMRVNETEGYLAFIIENRKAFKGDTSTSSMLAMIDRKQQHLLMMYLQERLSQNKK